MAIPQSEFRSIFTKRVVDIYREMTSPTLFLKSFFPDTFTMTKYVSVEVRRGLELAASDVSRDSRDGNRKSFSQSSEKLFLPPLYHEYMNITDKHLYDVAIGQGPGPAMNALAEEVAMDLQDLENMILRSHEKQCAQFLETGVAQFDANTNIDFLRKAASLVDWTSTSTAWTDSANAVPFDNLKEAAKFVREKGKATGGEFIVLMGDEAWSAFLDTDQVGSYADWENIQLTDLSMPQKNAEGGTFHGSATGNTPYRFFFWTYPEIYEDAQGNASYYLDPKKVYVLPRQPRWNFSHAAVPQLIDTNGNTPQNAPFLTQEFMDEREGSHEFHQKNAAVVMPTAVDQIFTGKAVS